MEHRPPVRHDDEELTDGQVSAEAVAAPVEELLGLTAAYNTCRSRTGFVQLVTVVLGPALSSS